MSNGINKSDNKPAPRAKPILINGLTNRYSGIANKLRPNTIKFNNPSNNLIGNRISVFAIESNEIRSGKSARTGPTTGIKAVNAATIPLTTAEIIEAAVAAPASKFNNPKTNERTNLAPSLNAPTKNLKMWIKALMPHLTNVLIASCPRSGNENNAIPRPANIKIFASVRRPQMINPPTAFATSNKKKLRICAATINSGNPTKIVAAAIRLMINSTPFLIKSTRTFRPSSARNVNPATKLLKNSAVMNPSSSGIEILNNVINNVLNSANGVSARNVNTPASTGNSNALSRPSPKLNKSNNALMIAIGNPINENANTKSIAPLINACATVRNNKMLNVVNCTS